MLEIQHYLEINAPAPEVFKAVTEQEGLAGWWTEDAIARPQVGSIAEFKFGEHYHNKMRITNLIPNSKVEWECLQGDKEWIGTSFTFDISEKSGKTALKFTHKDWREATNFYASCNYHWGLYMKSLKDYCETGKGEPYKKS
jgi:uncharacterized protein YndB with AHSA1/START domain